LHGSEYGFDLSRLTTVEEMLSIGLYLNDLNFYDGSSEILISGIQHAKQLQTAIEKVRERLAAIVRLVFKLWSVSLSLRENVCKLSTFARCPCSNLIQKTVLAIMLWHGSS
jgi:hypothetical protein